MLTAITELPVKPEKQWFTGASSNRCGYVNIYEVNCKWSHDRAFTDSEDDYWCSGRGTYAWSTGSSGHTYDGIEIWRRFTEPHNLAKISFKSLYKIGNVIQNNYARLHPAVSKIAVVRLFRWVHPSIGRMVRRSVHNLFYTRI